MLVLLDRRPLENLSNGELVPGRDGVLEGNGSSPVDQFETAREILPGYRDVVIRRKQEGDFLQATAPGQTPGPGDRLRENWERSIFAHEITTGRHGSRQEDQP
jgi:hypothetical protein